jgi:hypothetical protein
MIVKPRNYHLVLDAGHGEYMPGVAQGRTLFDPTEHDWVEGDEEVALAKLREHLPPEALGFEPYDPTWNIIVELEGTIEELAAAFESLLGDVSGVPSGDDDTFDYWPSGARMLLAFAEDMDELYAGRVYELRGSRSPYRESAVHAIESVLEAKGDLADELADKIPGLR